MDSSIKLFLVFCFAVFFFSGCQQKGNDTVIRAGTPGKGPAVQQKAISEKNAKDIEIVIQSLREMDQRVRDIWFVIANQENSQLQIPASALTVTLRSLLLDYNDNGQKKVKETKASRCETGRPVLEWKEEKDARDQRKFLVYQIFFRSCQGVKFSNQAMVEWVNDDKGTVEIHFNAEQLSREPLNGLGKLTPQSEDVTCLLNVGLGKKQLQAFRCTNLSQDWRGANEVKAQKSFKFADLDFDWRREHKLKGRYLIFDFSSPEPKVKAYEFTDDQEKKLLTLSKEALSDAEKAKMPFPLTDGETQPTTPAPDAPASPAPPPSGDEGADAKSDSATKPAAPAKPPQAVNPGDEETEGRAPQPEHENPDQRPQRSAPREPLPQEVVT